MVGPVSNMQKIAWGKVMFVSVNPLVFHYFCCRLWTPKGLSSQFSDNFIPAFVCPSISTSFYDLWSKILTFNDISLNPWNLIFVFCSYAFSLFSKFQDSDKILASAVRCLGFLVASAPNSSSAVQSSPLTGCVSAVGSEEESFISQMEGTYARYDCWMDVDDVYLSLLMFFLQHIIIVCTRYFNPIY